MIASLIHANLIVNFQVFISDMHRIRLKITKMISKILTNLTLSIANRFVILITKLTVCIIYQFDSVIILELIISVRWDYINVSI